MQASIYPSASPFSSVYSLWFWRCAGLRLHALRQFDVIGLFAGVEAGVFQHQHRAGRGALDGAVGLLDRVAPLCFAAPVFFHSVRWFFRASA